MKRPFEAKKKQDGMLEVWAGVLAVTRLRAIISSGFVL